MDIAIRGLRFAAQQLAHGKAPRTIRYLAPFRAAGVRVEGLDRAGLIRRRSALA